MLQGQEPRGREPVAPCAVTVQSVLVVWGLTKLGPPSAALAHERTGLSSESYCGVGGHTSDTLSSFFVPSVLTSACRPGTPLMGQWQVGRAQQIENTNRFCILQALVAGRLRR